MTKRSTEEIFAQRMSEQTSLVDRLLDVVGSVPTPREQKSDEPHARSRAIARKAAVKAAASAGALALPPGPLGWLTIAPELYAVWKIQAQMVADIAGAYGKPELLSRGQMLYCLFSHTTAKAFTDLVIRVGQRFVVRRVPVSAIYAIANKVAIRIAQRSASRMLTRWVPAVGALGVAGYVYIDSGRVAEASIELFSADLRVEEMDQVDDAPQQAAEPAARKKRAAGSRSAGDAAKRKRTSADGSTPVKGKRSAKPTPAAESNVRGGRPTKAATAAVRKRKSKAKSDAPTTG